PRLEHLNAAKRVLKYLKGTSTYGIFYGRKSNEKLKVFTDSNYARDVEDRKCTSGYICLYSRAAISWSSRKQEIVTLSSTEAEYVAVANCACHCKWLKEDLAATCLWSAILACGFSSRMRVLLLSILPPWRVSLSQFHF
nr:putative RNA-directed DNA polymerase [Tanacetum cinerariifolium]